MLKETVEKVDAKEQRRSAWVILKEERKSVVITQESYRATCAAIADDLHPERHIDYPPGQYDTVIKRYRNDGDMPNIKAFKITEKYFNAKLDSRILSVFNQDVNAYNALNKIIKEMGFENYIVSKKNLDIEFNCGTSTRLLFLLTQLNKLTPFNPAMQKNITLHFCKTDAFNNENANKFRSCVFKVPSLSDLCCAFIRDKYKIFSPEALNRLPSDVKVRLPLQSNVISDEQTSRASDTQGSFSKARMRP